MTILERFLYYVSFDTQSDETSDTVPSTEKQRVFAQELEKELIAIGLDEVTLDHNGYVMATLSSNIPQANIPVIGFIAHMDTSPDLTGKEVHPQIITYDGDDIILNKEQQITLSANTFPELNNYIGQELIVTDGTTLLGADDKAGIAAIVTAMQHLIAHPEIPHGKVRIAFTPDEEIGRGADCFDVEQFGCDWAYTIDGGELGELEYENFNAAEATITIQGLNVHPGYAKNKMINALNVAFELHASLPPQQRPEQTEGYEGFFHLTQVTGDVDSASIHYIIRDHSRKLFEEKKQRIKQIVQQLNLKYDGRLTLNLRDQYYNMREIIAPRQEIIQLAHDAMIEVGITPHIKAIRGGTDGARLSFMGLPCPNLFAGGLNFHGRYEFLPVNSLIKSAETIIQIIKKNR